MSMTASSFPLTWRSSALLVAGSFLVVGCTSSSEPPINDPNQSPDALRSAGCLAKLDSRPIAPLMVQLQARTLSTKTATTGKTPAVNGPDQSARLLAPVDVTFRVTVPANTPADAEIFIAGDFQGWNPGSEAHRFTRVSAGLYAITLALKDNTAIQFKITRGSWETVEKGSQGEELQNRVFQVAGPETAEIMVASWANTAPAPPRTIVGDIDEMSVPGLLDGRRVWVYLPPGYASDVDTCYPVLYMLDGQNLFDSSTAFLGNEWDVDQTLEDTIAAGHVQPVIVVAIDNGGEARVAEYTPFASPDFEGSGQGEAHLQAIEEVLIPFVNDNFRALLGPQNTGISGSSLGGLMSLYAAYAHGDTFGAIGALSPSLWWNDENLRQFVETSSRPERARIYMDMGTMESSSGGDENNNGVDDNVDHLRALRDVLVAQGFTLGVNLEVVEDEGGRHNEDDWRRRFPDTLHYLFPPPLQFVSPPAR